jgi:hypothetical protein
MVLQIYLVETKFIIKKKSRETKLTLKIKGLNFFVVNLMIKLFDPYNLEDHK